MDEVTQQNAALVEEAAAASQSLQDQAGTLSQVVSVFQLPGQHRANTEHISPQTRPKTLTSRPLVAPAKRGIAATAQAKIASNKESDGDWEQF